MAAQYQIAGLCSEAVAIDIARLALNISNASGWVACGLGTVGSAKRALALSYIDSSGVRIRLKFNGNGAAMAGTLINGHVPSSAGARLACTVAS